MDPDSNRKKNNYDTLDGFPIFGDIYEIYSSVLRWGIRYEWKKMHQIIYRTSNQRVKCLVILQGMSYDFFLSLYLFSAMFSYFFKLTISAIIS